MIILNPIFYAISEKTDSIKIGLVCYYIIFVNLKLSVLHNINYVKQLQQQIFDFPNFTFWNNQMNHITEIHSG